MTTNVFISCAGIGRAIAMKLALCGAETVAISRTQADLDSLKAEVDYFSSSKPLFLSCTV